jgi:hypothetical protein
LDAEIKAMADIVTALQGLDQEGIGRVLRWAFQRYQVSLKLPAGTVTTDARALEGRGTIERKAFDSFHELFDAANPNTGSEKALVAGYWFQVLQGQDDLDSQQLNKELKDLGHPSANITRDLDRLIDRTPRYAMQVRKQGSTQQARKRYKLTREGIKAVEAMFGSKDEDA